MFSWKFKRLYNDLKVRVEEEGKKNPSWLLGYLQGRGDRKLTGYQFGALVDLLLVQPDAPVVEDPVAALCVPDKKVPEIERKTLAQR